MPDAGMNMTLKKVPNKENLVKSKELKFLLLRWPTTRSSVKAMTEKSFRRKDQSYFAPLDNRKEGCLNFVMLIILLGFSVIHLLEKRVRIPQSRPEGLFSLLQMGFGFLAHSQ